MTVTDVAVLLLGSLTSNTSLPAGHDSSTSTLPTRWEEGKEEEEEEEEEEEDEGDFPPSDHSREHADMSPPALLARRASHKCLKSNSFGTISRVK
jgi:hypothetical protein